MTAIAPTLPRQAINAKLVSLLAAAAIALGVFLSGFVIREPAPYELYMAVLIPIWALFGLHVSRGMVPLLVLLVVFNLGGVVSMLQMADLNDAPLYLAVSLFLALTSVFFAAVLEQRPALYRLIFQAWIAAALSTAFFGILGYFHAFPGAEMFTKFERAAGVFEDPNVFGPFITLPGIYLLYRLLTGPIARIPYYALPLLVIAFGLFLSFSRGAWGLFAISAMLITLAVFVRHRGGAFRMKIIVMALIALALLVTGILIALQVPAIADLFASRARLVQDYDGARLGRFARHAIGFSIALENPLGIGPLEFGKTFGEDTHNIWLKSLLAYSWLGFAAYAVLIVWTLAAGFRILLRDRPWHPYLLCAYVVLVGHILLGTVIDTDHWRHFYLLLGLVWGAIALEYRLARTGPPRAPSR